MPEPRLCLDDVARPVVISKPTRALLLILALGVLRAMWHERHEIHKPVSQP